MRPALSSTRAQHLWLALAVGAVVAAAGLWAQNDALVGVNYDDAIYASLAKSVVDGDGYRLTYTPEEIPGIKYPPLYPLTLVPAWTLTGSPEAAFEAMKRLNGLLIGIAAGLFFLLLVELGVLPLGLAATVTLVGFLAGSMMLVTAGVLSEPLYLAILFGALLLADGTDAAAGTPRLLAVGLLVGMVCLTRMVGLSLVPAVLAGLWWRCGRRRALIALTGLGVVLIPWILFTLLSADQVPELLVPRYGSYLQRYAAGVAGSPSAALGVAATNVGVILQTLGVKLVPYAGTVGRGVAAVVLLGLATVGARAVFSKSPATSSYPLFYLLVISVWTFPPFRFVFILVPLLLALAVVGILRLAGSLAGLAGRSREPWIAQRASWAQHLTLAMAALLAINLAYREIRSVARRVWDGAELAKSEVTVELIAWVGANTGPDDVIAYEFDPMLALHTGRTTVPNNWEPSHPWYQDSVAPVDQLARLFIEFEVDYVALRRNVTVVAAPIDALMGARPGGLRLVHITPGGVVILQTDRAALAVGAETAAGRDAAEIVR
jgi:hypothetical protein